METGRIYNHIEGYLNLKGFNVSEEKVEELTNEFLDECESQEISDYEKEYHLKKFMVSAVDKIKMGN